MEQTNDLFVGCFQLQQGDGDGPKQVPTLLRAMASALSWGLTTRLLAQSNYITLFPAPSPYFFYPCSSMCSPVQLAECRCLSVHNGHKQIPEGHVKLPLAL